MDRAARNFFALTGLSVVLAANALCALAVYVAAPILEGDASPGLADLAPIFLLAVVLAISVGLGVAELRRSLIATRSLAHRVEVLTIAPSESLIRSAEASGLAGRVDLLDTDEGFSFAYGLAFPRVAISRGLMERLSPGELGAALEHEGYHVRSRDPLRSVIAAVLVESIFLLPSLGVLRRRYEATRELAADRSAEQRCGRRPLLGALLKALEAPRWSQRASIASLGNPSLLSMRLTQIETGISPALSSGGGNCLGQSIIGAGALVVVFAAAIIAVGGDSSLKLAVEEQVSPSGALFNALCVVPALAVAIAGYLAPRIFGHREVALRRS
jgi:hypothetical protein